MSGLKSPRADFISALREYRARKIPNLEFHQESLAYLSQFAVTFRYPGEAASREQAKRALKIMRELRAILRTALGLANT